MTNPEENTVFQEEYEALRFGAALQMRPNAGVLILSEADRVDFLQRMTTNDINALRQGQSCITVLTSPTARILYVFAVIAREGDLLLLPAEGQTGALAHHLRSQIFFMDNVQVEDSSEDFARCRLMGPGAPSTLECLGFGEVQAVNGSWWERDGMMVVIQSGYDVPGFEILAPVDLKQSLEDRMRQCGAKVLTGATAYTTRRVELGRPLPGRELTEAYSPLEAGLRWACAENKGCYTGQEIIARQITYDKVTRSLVGLYSDGPLTPGADISVDGRPVGQVTSAAYSPGLGATIAMAIVKRPHNDPGSSAVVEDESVRMAKLPFLSD